MEAVMSATMTGLIGIAVMLLLFATRMPVAFVMGLVGFVGFSVLRFTYTRLTLTPLSIALTDANRAAGAGDR